MEYSILAVLCLSIVVFAAADSQNQASEEQRRIALLPYLVDEETRNVSRVRREDVVVAPPNVFRTIRDVVSLQEASKELLMSVKEGDLLNRWHCSDVWDRIEGLVDEEPHGFLAEIKNLTKLDEKIHSVTDMIEEKLYLGKGCPSTNVTDTVGSAFSGKYDRIARSTAQETREEFIERFGECDSCVDPRCDSMYVQEECGDDFYANGTCYTAFVNSTSTRSGWCLFHKERRLLICSRDKVAELPWNVTNFSRYGDRILWDSNC
eukprot:GHVS01069491.1.p1 GENE.GHVS01069491.1~~GHVS01069491.1.p1  ORF type:complete len:263 (+),score=15.03 GHVS01069491.1:140-928(+)